MGRAGHPDRPMALTAACGMDLKDILRKNHVLSLQPLKAFFQTHFKS